jgi:cytosine/creatinine deaminase
VSSRLLGVRIPGRQNWVDIHCSGGVISSISDHDASHFANSSNAASPEYLRGALVMPSLAHWHTHLDKTFTIERAAQTEPGLLGAIQACIADHKHWTEQDLIHRASQALEESWANGCTLVRTHIDWVQLEGNASPPLAWRVFSELAQQWLGRIKLERVALLRSEFFDTGSSSESELAPKLQAILKTIQSTDGILGAFVHSSNITELRMNCLVKQAQKYGLAIDLHLDEEINPNAKGLQYLLDAVKISPTGRPISASHACALSVKSPPERMQLIDDLAASSIEVIALPATNLFLQDQTDPHQPLTPTIRGIAPVHELKRAGVLVKLACDNVQDPFYPWGNYDPLALMNLAAPALQLSNCFDQWSASICDGAIAIGAPANFTVVKGSAAAWPSAVSERRFVRNGRFV